jgi:hypothetical protein
MKKLSHGLLRTYEKPLNQFKGLRPMSELKKLETKFGSLKINVHKPGFYNDLNFIKEELKNPYLLDEYASYVVHRKYDDDYLRNAKKIIENVVGFLSNEIETDGSLGTCVSASGYLVKILEELGIWSFATCGMTKLTIKDKSIPDIYFRPYNIHGIVGHQWVFAPPFKIIDLTLKFQKYDNSDYSNLLNPFYLIEHIEQEPFSFFDFVDPEMIPRLSPPYTLNTLMKLNPEGFKLGTLLPNGSYSTNKYTVSYYSLATKMSEEKSIDDFHDSSFKPNNKTLRMLLEEFKQKYR